MKKPTQFSVLKRIFLEKRERETGGLWGEDTKNSVINLHLPWATIVIILIFNYLRAAMETTTRGKLSSYL